MLRPVLEAVVSKAMPAHSAGQPPLLERRHDRTSHVAAGAAGELGNAEHLDCAIARDEHGELVDMLLAAEVLHQGWHFSRQKVVYAICRFKPVFTGKKWQKLAKNSKTIFHFCCSFYSRCLSLHSQCTCIAINL